jgi:hypothetical protein
MTQTTTDFEKTAADFLAICPERRKARCADALDKLCAATEGTPLYNVDYKDIKDLLGRAVDEAWMELISNPWLRGKGCNPQSDLSWHVGSPSNLHSVVSSSKKLGKLKPESKLEGCKFSEVAPEMVATVRRILDAALPVALLVKELKGSVVKGRKPSNTTPDPEALAKEAAKRTCPCCFRAMALDSQGNVVRHGWQEQGHRRAGSYGNVWHTGSCFGVGYKPYEVSCQGTKDYHAALLPVEAQMAEALAKLEARPAKLHGSYKKGYGRNAETVQFTLEDDGGSLDNLTWRDRPDSYSNPSGTYAYNLNLRIANAKSDLEALRRDLATLAKAVADWKKAA